MVDYSKWDNFDDSSDDEQPAAAAPPPPQPAAAAAADSICITNSRSTALRGH